MTVFETLHQRQMTEFVIIVLYDDDHAALIVREFWTALVYHSTRTDRFREVMIDYSLPNWHEVAFNTAIDDGAPNPESILKAVQSQQ